MLTAMRSISFDIKLMLDIDGYDLISAGSSVGFVPLGPRMSFVCENGNRPCSNDSLIMLVACTKVPAICITNLVGIGSIL